MFLVNRLVSTLSLKRNIFTTNTNKVKKQYISKCAQIKSSNFLLRYFHNFENIFKLNSTAHKLEIQINLNGFHKRDILSFFLKIRYTIWGRIGWLWGYQSIWTKFKESKRSMGFETGEEGWRIFQLVCLSDTIKNNMLKPVTKKQGYTPDLPQTGLKYWKKKQMELYL